LNKAYNQQVPTNSFRNLLFQMKSIIILYSVICFPILAIGQVNLVPNADFEDTIRCPSDFSITKARYWYNPTICGSPDYFYPTMQGNLACVDQLAVGNSWGGGSYVNNWGFQMPRSGNAYAGMGVPEASELMAVKLIDSLSPGKEYSVSFYTSLSNNSRSGIDLIQFAFMEDSVTDYNINTCWNYLSNLQSDAGNDQGNIIIDTVNWVLVNDTFVAAGGELYMVIGNIDTAQTQYYLIDSINPSRFAYYYFDDFDVHCIDCTSDTSEPPVYPEITITPTLTQGELLLSGNFPLGAKFEVYDVLGQLVFYDELQSGNQTQSVFLPLGAGVYTCTVMADGSLLKAEKVVVVK
jgi:hypothetical protein